MIDIIQGKLYLLEDGTIILCTGLGYLKTTIEGVVISSNNNEIPIGKHSKMWNNKGIALYAGEIRLNN